MRLLKLSFKVNLGLFSCFRGNKAFLIFERNFAAASPPPFFLRHLEPEQRVRQASAQLLLGPRQEEEEANSYT